MRTQKYRRIDDVTPEEVKDFWHGFCARRRIDEETRALGELAIDIDPDFWADQTMPRLLQTVHAAAVN